MLWNEHNVSLFYSSQIIRCCRVFSLAVGVSIQKKRETVLVARPTHRGSGIAHRSWTSKLAEPHAEYDTSTDNARALSAYWRWLLIFALASTVCYILGYDWIYQIPMSQERASSKRFPKMSLPKPSRIAHDWALLGRSTSANLHTIFVVYKIMGRIFVPGCGCWGAGCLVVWLPGLQPLHGCGFLGSYWAFPT